MPDDRHHSLGPTVTPLRIIQALRWSADLDADATVQAIRAGAEETGQWPELTPDEAATMRSQAGMMSRSRLRAWREGKRQPTWLEVRALASGMHHVVEEAPQERGKDEA